MRRAALLLGLCLPACGYQQGFGPPGLRKVAVRTVEDLSYRQGLDVLLTRRLLRDLPHYTGLLPARPGSAQAILEVTLREVSGRSLQEGAAGAVQEGAVLLAAEVRLREVGSGRILYRGKHTDWAEFRAPVGETLATATEEAVRDLSRKILTALASDR